MKELGITICFIYGIKFYSYGKCSELKVNLSRLKIESRHQTLDYCVSI